ncbi:MAG: hypothetical protein CMF28_05305 [Kiritimatiellaceae bacterium]|nr:hypothetical protein [Kiritimatiellaceae bacterium]
MNGGEELEAVVAQDGGDGRGFDIAGLRTEGVGCHADKEGEVVDEELVDTELMNNGSVGGDVAGVITAAIGKVAFAEGEKVGVYFLGIAEFHPAGGGAGVEEGIRWMVEIASADGDDGKVFASHG